jgi:UDP-N-acetylglucosamine 2-epimerase (non-hydrolysing)/GDP/UDP-N,N'-diacetylbacillosamine 2-epimerase (hydrolysing)
MHSAPVPPNTRRIAVISSSRADYGHLYWLLRDLHDAADVDLRIIATAAHLSPRFGATVDRFAEDGFVIEAATESLIDSDTDVGMAKTIGVAVLGLADVLARLRPDLLLLIADRYEMLAPAATALALRIPIAHIEGGEISEGAIDDAVRNALTKLSHLHFVSTHTARRRVMAMGEAAWRVHRAGAPSLDHLERSRLPDKDLLEARLGMPLGDRPRVVSIHPVTLDTDPTADARALLAALDTRPEPTVFCFPNADAGHEEIIDLAGEFCRRHEHARLFVNLGPVDYWGLLKCAGLLVGNSSSGIMESPSLGLPCVNVGSRQQGRERAPNVIDAPGEPQAIITAMACASSEAFRESIRGIQNPYGNGDAARRIVQVLRSCPLGSELLVKRALPLTSDGRPAFNHDAS